MSTRREITRACISASAMTLITLAGCSERIISPSTPPSSALTPVAPTAVVTAATCAPLVVAGITANTNDGNVPANAIDGNLNTRWSGDGVGSNITADLGSTKTVCGVNVAWYQGTTRRNNYVISVSTTGSSFQTVATGTSSGTTNNRESYTFAQASARYVRVTVNGNTINNWASITELQVPGVTDTTTPPSSGAYNQAVLADHPVAFWGMTAQSGTESDLSGNGRTGTYRSGTPTTTTMPNGDNAAIFNGSSQYLNVPSNAAFSIPTTRNFTWEAWIRPDVLEFPNASLPDGYVHFMGKCESYSPTCEWAARMYKSTTSQGRCNRLSAYVFNNSAGLGSGADWQPTCGLITAGAWLHVVGEYTTLSQPSNCPNAGTYPGSINIWVNGVKWNQASHGTTGCMSQYNIIPRASTSALSIGTLAREDWFKGAIGKVALYNVLLSQAQITNHYNKMTGKQPTGSCGNTCTF